MKTFGKRVMLSALAAVALTTACAESSQTMPPRASVSEPTPASQSAFKPAQAVIPTALPATSSPPQAVTPTAVTVMATVEKGRAVMSTPPAMSSPSQAATDDPAEIFQSASTAMNALSTYRAEMEHVLATDMMGMSGEIKTEVNANVQSPGKIGGDMILALTGEPPITTGFVIVGDDAYVGVEDPDSPQTRFWAQTALEEIAPLTSFLTWFETDSDYEFAPAELVGTEDLNGEETYRLRGLFTVKNLPGGVEQPEDIEADVWIGVSDSLIRKVAAAGEVDEISIELEISISYSRFNDAAIQVEAPSDFIAAP